MALLTRVGVQGRRFLTAARLRAWWALRSQKRRRERASGPLGTPPVPVITAGDYWWEASEADMYDVSISWTIDYGSFPVASVEVWGSCGGEGEQLQGTVPSADLGFYHARATEGGQALWYRGATCSRTLGGRWWAPSRRCCNWPCRRRGVSTMALTLVKEDGTGRATRTATRTWRTGMVTLRGICMRRLGQVRRRPAGGGVGDGDAGD